MLKSIRSPGSVPNAVAGPVAVIPGSVPVTIFVYGTVNPQSFVSGVCQLTVTEAAAAVETVAPGPAPPPPPPVAPLGLRATSATPPPPPP